MQVSMHLYMMALAERVAFLAVRDAHVLRKKPLLNLVYGILPADSTLVSLWITYVSLYKKAVSEKKASLPFSRTLMKAELTFHRNFHFKNVQTKQNGQLLLIPFAYLDSLIVFLMDPVSLSFPPPSFNLPTLAKTHFGTVVVPSNEAGNSCFCDVVLVAMFLATDRYDVLLVKENMFSFFWKDDFLQDMDLVMNWVSSIQSSLDTSACFEQQRKKDPVDALKKTADAADNIRTLLREHIVLPMRTPAQEDTYPIQTFALGRAVSTFRRQLIKDCGRGTMGQDDASEMFRTILEVGGWGPLFFPMTRETRVDTFVDFLGKESLFENVPALVRSHIQAPELPRLEFSKGFKTGDSLQRLIDMNFLGEVRDEEHIFMEPLSPGVFEDYIFEHDPDMYLTNLESFQKNGFRVRTVISPRLARVPDLFAFAVARGVPGVLFPEGRRVFTRVSIPVGEIIRVPFLDHTPEVPNETMYRVVAMACHLGVGGEAGHYVLYFRYAEGNTWYFYDDMNATLNVVDIHEDVKPVFAVHASSHRQVIQENAYLFWAIKIE